MSSVLKLDLIYPLKCPSIYAYMLVLNFDPKRVTRILFDLQTEHNSDKACYEDAKYPIGFIVTQYLKEMYSVLKSAPPGTTSRQISDQNTLPKRIGPTMINTVPRILLCYRRTRYFCAHIWTKTSE